MLEYFNVLNFVSPSLAPELPIVLYDLTTPFKCLMVFSNLTHANLNSWYFLQNLLYPQFSPVILVVIQYF